MTTTTRQITTEAVVEILRGFALAAGAVTKTDAASIARACGYKRVTAAAIERVFECCREIETKLAAVGEDFSDEETTEEEAELAADASDAYNEDEDDGDGDEDERSIVKRGYKKAYGKGAHCGDPVALAMASIKDITTADNLNEVAKDNGVDLSRWAHLNPGQRRMCLGNVLRGMLKKGKEVRIAGKTYSE